MHVDGVFWEGQHLTFSPLLDLNHINFSEETKKREGEWIIHQVSAAEMLIQVEHWIRVRATFGSTAATLFSKLALRTQCGTAQVKGYDASRSFWFDLVESNMLLQSRKPRGGVLVE